MTPRKNTFPRSCATLPCLAALALCLALWPGCRSFAGENLPRLAAYTEEDISTRLPDGGVSGFYVELAKEIFRRAGIEGRVEIRPWSRAYATALAEPGIMLLPVLRTPDREALFHWLAPASGTRLVFYRRRGAGPDIASLEDARRARRIIVCREDASAQFLAKKGFTNLQTISSGRAAIQMMERGRADLYAAPGVFIAGRRMRGDPGAADLEPVFVFAEYSLHPALSRGTDPAIVEACARAMREISQDGTLAALRKHWKRNPQ